MSDVRFDIFISRIDPFVVDSASLRAVDKDRGNDDLRFPDDCGTDRPRKARKDLLMLLTALLPILLLSIWKSAFVPAIVLCYTDIFARITLVFRREEYGSEK